MKTFVKRSMMITLGILLAVVSGCKDEKTAESGAEEIKQAVPKVEQPTTKLPAADKPKDHPAH